MTPIRRTTAYDMGTCEADFQWFNIEKFPVDRWCSFAPFVEFRIWITFGCPPKEGMTLTRRSKVMDMGPCKADVQWFNVWELPGERWCSFAPFAEFRIWITSGCPQRKGWHPADGRRRRSCSAFAGAPGRWRWTWGMETNSGYQLGGNILGGFFFIGLWRVDFSAHGYLRKCSSVLL